MLRCPIALIVFLSAAPLAAQPSPEIAPQLDCPPTAAAGEAIPCTVRLTNVGTADAPQAAIHFSQGQNRFAGASRNLTCSSSAGSDMVACFTGPIPAGSTFTGTIFVSSPATMMPGNIITLDVNAGPTDHAVAKDWVSSFTLIDRAISHIQLTSSAPATVTGGDVMTFAVKVTALGPSFPGDVFFTYQPPGGATLLSISTNNFPCGIPDADGRVVCSPGLLLEIPHFGPYTAKYDFTIRAPQNAGAIENSVSLTQERDPQAVQTTSASTVVQAPPADSADISITVDPKSYGAEPGSSFTYLLTVANNGPAISRSTTIVDQLPAGATAVSLPQNCSGTDKVTCSLPDLSPGTSTALTLNLTLPANRNNLENIATVSNARDAIQSNNASRTPLAVTSPIQADLSIALQSMTRASHGERGFVTVDVENQSDVIAKNVRWQLTMPSAMTISMVEADSAYRCSTATAAGNNTLTCTLSSLSRSAGLPVTTVFFNVSPSVAVDSTLPIRATISSDTPDPSLADNDVTAQIAVAGFADLESRVTPDVRNAQVGDRVVWTIVVSNHGMDTARGLTMNAKYAQVLDVATSTGTCTKSSTDVTCALGDFAPEAQATITLTGVAALDVPGPSRPVVTFTSSKDFLKPPITGLPTAPVIEPVLVSPPPAHLTISGQAPPTVPDAGDVSFAVTVKNTGSVAAPSATLNLSTQAGVTITSIQQAPGQTFQCTVAQSTATCVAPALAAGETASFTIATRSASAGKTRELAASITSDSSDRDYASEVIRLMAGSRSARRRGVGH